MRDLIISLNTLLGSQYNKQINRWVSRQYSRQSICHREFIALKDVPEQDIILTVSSAISKLFRHCLVIPSVNHNMQKFTAVFEIKPSFYKQLLTSGKKIRIDAMSVVNKGDLFERYGQTKHITHKANIGTTEPVYCFINGTIVDSDEQFSLGFNQTELHAVGESTLEKKYNGVNPFTIEEWHDISFSALFLRLLDDDPFVLIHDSLKKEKLEKYRDAKTLSMTYIKKNEEDDSAVYSSYGRIIANKFNRFDALSARQNTEAKPPTLTIVTSNDSPHQQASAKSQPVEVKKTLTSTNKGFVYDEFGDF